VAHKHEPAQRVQSRPILRRAKAIGKQEITGDIKFLTWLEEIYGRTSNDLIRTFFIWVKKSKINIPVQIGLRQAKTTPTVTQERRLACLTLNPQFPHPLQRPALTLVGRDTGTGRDRGPARRVSSTTAAIPPRSDCDVSATAPKSGANSLFNANIRATTGGQMHRRRMAAAKDN
jgi:hypothetical protein